MQSLQAAAAGWERTSPGRWLARVRHSHSWGAMPLPSPIPATRLQPNVAWMCLRWECDVADEASVVAAFHRAGDAYILVNNAGQSKGAELKDTSRALWDAMINVNLTGTYLCTQQVLSGMQRNGEGRIINIASTAGLKGYTRITAYCAAKHGVVGFTRALAAETARTGVTVNAICPSYIEGEMSDRAVAQIAEHRGISEEQARQKLTRLIPVGRLIKPSEVTSAVLWLCSPDAGAITGQAIAVAGGEV